MIINKIICLIKGHKLKKFRAPIHAPLSWPGWKDWSGIKCIRCYGVKRLRKGHYRNTDNNKVVSK